MKNREADRRIRNIINQASINKKVDIAADAYKKEHAPKPLHVEKRIEYVLIDIPDNTPLNELPALVSGLYYYKDAAEGIKPEAWSSQIKNYKLEVTCNLHIASDNDIIHEVVTRLLHIPCFKRDQLPMQPLTYDMYCRIDEDVISSFRMMNKYHAAAVYGIVFGTEASSMFPIDVDKLIEGVEYDTAHVDILVIDDSFANYAKVWQWIGEAFTTLRVSIASPNVNSFRAMIGAINQTQMVVGPTSLYTYLACAMKKPTLEIYPLDISRNWLSKWDNTIYHMYRRRVEDLEQDKLLKGVALVWAKACALKYKIETARNPILGQSEQTRSISQPQ